MSKVADFQILLADNDEIFVRTCRSKLEAAGFSVIVADNPAAAAAILQTERVHMAILDVRMERDSDEKDKSGLLVAKQTSRQIPKIILTKFPAYQDVVEVLKQDMQGYQAAVEFLDKRDTRPEQLVTAVQNILAQYVTINWDLVIQWQPMNTFLQLVSCLTPQLSDKHLASRAAEFEDLFRKLFRDFVQITIGPAFTQQGSRLMLPVFAFDIAGTETRFIVSCGCQTAVLAENQRYQKRVPDRLSIKNLGRLHSEQTTNFGATAYTFLGKDLEATATIHQLYRKRAIENLLPAIDYLYQTNLGGWYETGREKNKQADLHAFYHQWLHLDELISSMHQFNRLLPALADRALAAQLLELEVDARQLTFQLRGESETYRFPNPVALLAQNRLPQTRRAHWGITHGRISGDTVLVDQEQRAWLLDFAQVGRAPLLIDFVSLETAVKFDLFSHRDFAHRLAIEIKLAQTSQLKDDINLDNLESEAINALWLIERVRQNAARLAGCDLEAYQQALFFCAIARVASFDPDTFYTQRKLAAYVHALLAAAMLAEQWQNVQSAPVPDEANEGIWLDHRDKRVWVESQPVELTSQEFKIMRYLYQNPGQLCAYDDILQDGLNEPGDPDPDELNRLHTAVSRLRRKTEPDPRTPRYLFTVHGRGYRLFLTPQFS
ncbi:MAG: DNA-binding response regulator [Ardenticatenaceae bacterium]|nr:DNA-binding response regulator [Ardenticatenaceae bacterium]MCB8975553.1 DNA-binding response regulator [Ardenticatenaceae bacterium]